MRDIYKAKKPIAAKRWDYRNYFKPHMFGIWFICGQCGYKNSDPDYNWDEIKCRECGRLNYFLASRSPKHTGWENVKE